MAALNRGDGEAAQDQFARLVGGGHATIPMRLMLARACRLSGNLEAETAALDELLQKDPGNLRGLLMRGDCSRRSGDVRAAATFFTTAITVAGRSTAVPADAAQDLREAEEYLEQTSREFAQAVEEAASDAVGDSPEGWRIRHAADIATGKREIFLQQPTVLYFPYLPQRQFYEREEFGWVAGLEAETPAIKEEVEALLSEGAPFEPYVQAEENRPHRDFHGLHGDPSWSAFYLWNNGALIEENAARCPRTVKALEKVPLTRIGGRTPAVLFSLLRPGAHIPPHNGMLNCRLIGHLPLIVPPGCWLRVGNETREWEEGEVLIFDDSIEHEARNPSDRLRVILLFDMWRPELNPADKEGVSAIFSAIDRLGGVPDED